LQQIPNEILEVSAYLSGFVPPIALRIFEDIFKLAGVDIVNILIWLGTIALLGDVLLAL